MITLPTRRGYEFGWETEEISKRTGKPIMDYFEHTNKEIVEAKREEMKNTGFIVTDITECIF